MAQENNTSGLAFAIIGLVLLAAIIGGIYFYSSSSNRKSAGTNANRNTNQQTNNLEAYRNAPPGAQPPHYKGSQNAPVVIEEFADFQCGGCAAIHPVMNEVNAAYGSRVKFIYRNFPLVQIHPKAYDASVAAEAAGFQGKFWDMQNLLFNNQQTWAASPAHEKIFEEYAQRIGLDVERYKSDIAGEKTKQRVDADLQRGRGLSITSTPTVYINGRSIPIEQINFSTMKQIIDAELQKTQTNNQPQSVPPPSGSNNTNAGNTNAGNK